MSHYAVLQVQRKHNTIIKLYFFRDKAFHIWFQVILNDQLWLQRMENQAYCKCLTILINGLWKEGQFCHTYFNFHEIRSFLLISSFVRYSDSMRPWHDWIVYRWVVSVLLHVSQISLYIFLFIENKFNPISKWYLQNSQQNWDYNHLENPGKSFMLKVIPIICFLE